MLRLRTFPHSLTFTEFFQNHVMTLRAGVFCLPAVAVASTYSGHTARTVGPRPAASPPLLLFLRKVLFLLSFGQNLQPNLWLHSPGTWISGTCGSSLPVLQFGGEGQEEADPPQKQFGECVPQGRQLFSVFTQALGFLRKLTEDLSTQDIRDFQFGVHSPDKHPKCPLKETTQSSCVSNNKSRPQVPTLSRCHVIFQQACSHWAQTVVPAGRRTASESHGCLTFSIEG